MHCVVDKLQKYIEEFQQKNAENSQKASRKLTPGCTWKYFKFFDGAQNSTKFWKNSTYDQKNNIENSGDNSLKLLERMHFQRIFISIYVKASELILDEPSEGTLE